MSDLNKKNWSNNNKIESESEKLKMKNTYLILNYKLTGGNLLMYRSIDLLTSSFEKWEYAPDEIKAPQRILKLKKWAYNQGIKLCSDDKQLVNKLICGQEIDVEIINIKNVNFQLENYKTKNKESEIK